MIGLQSLLPGASGKLKWQVLNTSGTFVPSAELLARGGVVRAILVPGGAGGSSGTIGGSTMYAGGHAGMPIDTLITLTGPTAYTVGAGGLGGASPQPGGNTSIAGVTATGGIVNMTNGTGGAGAGSLHNGSDGGIGLVLPIVGPCCAGGSRISTSGQPSISEAWGAASINKAAVPGKGSGGSGVSANFNGGSGSLVLIWEE